MRRAGLSCCARRSSSDHAPQRWSERRWSERRWSEKVVRKGDQKTTGRVSRLEGTVPARLLGRVGGVDSTPRWWDHGLSVDSSWRPRVGVAYLSCDAGGDIALGDCPCVVHRCARHTCGIRTLMFKNLTRPATIEYGELARRVRHLAPVCAASLWAYGRL